jgi:hypothetical protein
MNHLKTISIHLFRNSFAFYQHLAVPGQQLEPHQMSVPEARTNVVTVNDQPVTPVTLRSTVPHSKLSGGILRQNPNKSLEFSSLLFSHVYRFASRFLFLQTHETSYSFYNALLYKGEKRKT